MGSGVDAAAPRSDASVETPRIAVLAGNLDTEYPRTIIAGVGDRLRDAGYTSLVFGGGMLGEELGGEPLYRMVAQENCQGVLCLSGIVGQLVDRQRLSEFLSQYAPMPVVSIAVALDSGPSVVIDDEGGTYAAVAHLIEQHGRRRIGFLRGPASSAEAERRFLAYRAVLASHGLAFDPELVVQGSWTAVSGARGTEALLAHRRGHFDALAAANDVMAAAAALVLCEHGVAVPREVAVVGFDDAEEARFSVPPLTTVRQPLHRLGWLAADTLLAHMQKGLDAKPIVVLPKLVARDSCGCFLDGVPVIPTGSLAPPAAGERRTAAAGHPLLQPIRDVLEAAGLPLRDHAERLLSALDGDVHQASDGALLTTLREVLTLVPPFEASPWELRPITTLLRRWASMAFEGEEEMRMRAEGVIRDASILIAASARRSEAQRRLLSESRARTLSQVSRAISGTADMEELECELGAAAKRLRVRSCNAVLYDEPSQSGIRRLVVRTEPTGRRQLPVGGVTFDGRRLLPSHFRLDQGPGLVVVLGLEDANQRVGYVTVEAGRDELSLCSELARLISSGLSRVRREREVARLHAAERERSIELERATQELESNREQLVVSEKMAALGRLAAGMANEMGSPLEVVRASLAHITQLASSYEQLVSSADTAGAAHAAVLQSFEAAIAEATGSAERVAGFVQGIKVQTRDLARGQSARFDVVPVVKDTLLLLNHVCRTGQCELSFETSQPSMDVYGCPGRLAQILTALVTNAIEASRPKSGGRIMVRLVAEENGTLLEIEDQGVGIPAEDVPRVFDPLFTAKPLGLGTGLGLSIVQTIVAGEFNGSVQVQSHLGQGTKMLVHLPPPPATARSSAPPGALGGRT